MLNKEERKERNTRFWDQFRKIMRSKSSACGKKINWISYPLGVKDLYLRLEADSEGVRMCFDIQPKDDGIRAILWEQMTELKKVMEDETGPADCWNPAHHVVSGRTVSRIYWEQQGLSFMKDEDWPKMFEFLELKLMGFDRFYQEYKDILITLAE